MTSLIGVKIGMRAESGITPVESRGTIITIAAMIVCIVKAVAIGQRLRLRVAEDSSRFSANILLTSDEEFDTGERPRCSAVQENK